MSGKKRHPPVPTEFTIERDGEELTFSKYSSKQTGRLDLAIVPRFRFPVCPICLELDPDEAEHVPPGSLGGRVMTWTCKGCNNDFGFAEDKLRSFFDLETTASIEATDGSLPGKRVAKMAFRSSKGRPNGMFIRSAATGFEEILNTGSGKLHVKPLDMTLVHASLLKHAYLAACLTNREIPMTAEADRIRAVLVAGRDRDAATLETAQKALDYRPTVAWIEAPNAPPILLLETDETDENRWMFILGGRFMVQWPFKSLEPVLAGRLPSVAEQIED